MRNRRALTGNGIIIGGEPMRARGGLALAITVSLPPLARAGEPIALGGLRLILGGEASASVAPGDRGFFNDTGYDRNPLRLLRLSITAELRAGRRLAALAEIRSENVEAPRAYALYLRLRPWPEHGFDLQAGLVPPVFGAFPRRRYAADNPLIGEPLGYQYLTTVRADAPPLSAEDLLGGQGSGWRVRYPAGAPPSPGLPLVSGERWDAGVEARWGGERLEVAAALTQGTLSRPRVRDDNGGKQVSTRVAWRPAVGLVLGASAARGDYASDRGYAGFPMPSGCCQQKAWGADAEYSAGHAILRTEGVWTSWQVATRAEPLSAWAIMLEARYRLLPGLYVAARACRLDFSEIEGAAGFQPWDAPAARVEAGFGYSVRRNLLLKAVYQHNERENGFVRSHDLGAMQVLWWY